MNQLRGRVWLLLLFAAVSGCATPGRNVDPQPRQQDAVADPEFTDEVVETFYDDGQLRSRQEGRRYPDGEFVQHGASTTFWANGKKKLEIHYLEGEWHGPKTAWYQNGQVWQEGRFSHGKEDGTWTVWFPSGRKAQELNFDHGAWHGVWTEWHLNGQKKSEVTYVRGKKQGAERAWDEHGTLIEESEFVDGVLQP